MSSSQSKSAKGYGTAGSSKQHGKAAQAACFIETASGLQIPFIKSKDNAKLLPTYAAALQRTPEDYPSAEELDNLQSELELLLSNVAQRYRVLHAEFENLDKDERRNERRKTQAEAAAVTATVAANTSSNNNNNTGAGSSNTNNTAKRKRTEELSHSSSTARKIKYMSMGAAGNSSSSKNNNKQKSSTQVTAHTDDSMDYAPLSTVACSAGNKQAQKPLLPKNDTPNKFWLSVEPYCMPITNEDLRLLDDLLDQYNGALVPPIPELGEHYANIWALDDLKEIQQNSNPNVNANRLKSTNAAASAMLKKAETGMAAGVTGPLTQRLVSALIEEKVFTNAEEQLANLMAADSSNGSSENNANAAAAPMSFRALSMLRNGINLDKRLKKELLEQGLFNVSDFPNSDEDEIQVEIKRVIAELSSVAEYNSGALRNLHNCAQEEIKRLDIKRKLDLVDQELLEMYKRTMQNRAKRKPLSVDEQQEILRLTTQQKELSDQLETATANFQLIE